MEKRNVYKLKQTESVGLGNIFDHEDALQMLELGVPIAMGVFVDNNGEFYTSYALDSLFADTDFDEECKITEERGITDCYINVTDVEDYEALYAKYHANCIIDPSIMDLKTAEKFNSTLQALTNPAYCFDSEKCEQIRAELIANKPVTIDCLASIRDKYIDDKALETIRHSFLQNHCDEATYEAFVEQIDWSQPRLVQNEEMSQESEGLAL